MMAIGGPSNKKTLKDFLEIGNFEDFQIEF